MIDHARSRSLYDAGRRAMEEGDLMEAVDLLSKSAIEAPHFKTLELLGEALLLLGDPLAAIEPLAAATALNDQLRAPSLLAEAFLELGETDAARRFADRVLARDPGNRRARRVTDTIEADSE